jgi:hypothetical protein
MNPMRTIGAAGGSWRGKPYRQAQEWGLPARITGYRGGCADEPFGGTLDDECTRKEVVIENDIGWRIETMVRCMSDYGKPERPTKRPRKRRKRRPKPYPLKPLPRTS